MAHEGEDRFRNQYGPWALVAGASDGIGESFARGIAARGVNVVLLARREPVLRDLAKQIEGEHGVETRVVVADLTSPDLEERVASATEDLEIGLYVHNAGAVLPVDRFLDLPAEHGLSLVRLNCVAPVVLTHRFATRMRTRGRGGVLLVSSMAGLGGSARTAVYSAAKSFELILAESLWHELAAHGLDVMAVIAGATKTPAMLNSNPVFESYPGVMESVDVAEGALASLGRGPIYVAGEHNRQVAKSLSPVSRVGVINALSRGVAELNEVAFDAVEGEDFGALKGPQSG